MLKAIKNSLNWIRKIFEEECGKPSFSRIQLLGVTIFSATMVAMHAKYPERITTNVVEVIKQMFWASCGVFGVPRTVEALNKLKNGGAK